jgi:hypothetical protein
MMKGKISANAQQSNDQRDNNKLEFRMLSVVSRQQDNKQAEKFFSTKINYCDLNYRRIKSN